MKELCSSKIVQISVAGAILLLATAMYGHIKKSKKAEFRFFDISCISSK